MTVINIVYEFPTKELTMIADETRNALLDKKLVMIPSLDDCLQTYLHRKGMKKWLSENVTGPYQMYIMQNMTEQHSAYDGPMIFSTKPWFRNLKRHAYPGDELLETTIVLFRFEDAGDAMLFKMTWLEESN